MAIQLGGQVVNASQREFGYAKVAVEWYYNVNANFLPNVPGCIFYRG